MRSEMLTSRFVVKHKNHVFESNLICKMFVLLALLLLLGGCATSNAPEPVYNNVSTFNPKSDLPSDYPTKYLPDGNMWNSFRENLQMPVDTKNPHIKAQIKWYQANQGMLNRAIVRGAPFLYYAYQQTQRLGLPAELALIPIGESGFIASNVSNRGAVGLWQFMSPTAREFNLRMNKYYDGRRDPIASTNAALKYFTYLHDYFDNDWLLALAAYNTGPGNAQKAVMRNQRKNLPTDFWSLNLPRDTEEYIPKLLALSAIIKNPKKYGVYLTPVNDSLYFEQVNAGHQISLGTVAKLTDLKLSLIQNLNPGLTKSITEPTGPHSVLVPKSKASLLKKRLESGESVSDSVTDQTTEIISTHSSAEPEESVAAAPTTKYQKYTVKKNDTLRSIAKRYSTTPEKLRQINKLHSNTLKTKQKILVPTPKSNASTTVTTTNTESTTTATITTTTKKTKHTPSKKAKKTAAISPVTSAPATSATQNVSGYYEVGASDTIYSIAKKFNTSTAKLRELNNLPTNNIKPGQYLKIGSPKKKAPTNTNNKSSAKKTSSTKTTKHAATKKNKK
jgi:membrane-bound lytic murein transglycosylase D